MTANRYGQQRAQISSELIVAGVALAALVAAQLFLSSTFHGTNYHGVDGKTIQSAVLSMFHLGKPFEITGISALHGIGSQMVPKNVWANPSFWPFAWLERETATDVSALIALGCFATACYIMARCFDVPVLPSAIAAQSTITLFAPALLILHTPTNFCLTPGDAVVYAPYFIALGLLARVEPGSRRTFAMITVAIVACVSYSVYTDPLWTMIVAISWSVPFAVVTFGSLERKTILVRGLALACCFAILAASGVAEYLYTLSQYTARVQYAPAMDRVREAVYVSALSYSSTMEDIYIACGIGGLLGLVTLRGRRRLLVVAAFSAFAAYAIYSATYVLLLNAVWVPPIPIYVEQCLLPLYMTAAVAGAWGVLQTTASFLRAFYLRHLANRISLPESRFWVGVTGVILSLMTVACVPAAVASYVTDEGKDKTEAFNQRWLHQPELLEYLSEKIGLLGHDRQFRGSINFLTIDEDNGATLADLWSRGIPTGNEYSQLVSPQSVYFTHKLMDKDIRGHLNRLSLFWSYGRYDALYWKAMQMLGIRYSAEHWPLPAEFNPGLPLTIKPYLPQAGNEAEGFWYIYELPHPNIGDYSPTQVVTARRGSEIMGKFSAPDFDFRRQVVLEDSVAEPLLPARNVRLSVIRGGLHVSAESDGASLIVLPQQFSHCLRARDGRSRLVRANLMVTGLIFAGKIDTDILSDYGIFSPGCRRRDLQDVKRLDLKIDLRMVHLSGDRLFPDWNGAIARLRAVWAAFSEFR